MSKRIHMVTVRLLGVSVCAVLSNAGYAGTITVCWDGSADYTTIQAGIDAALDGDAIVVCNGTYTGNGNRDLDFSNNLPEGQTRAITVRSENGPDNCIIDCEGSATNLHRGFYFHSGETAASVVDGFTIRNGYVHIPMESGGGIYCDGSSPKITNCTIAGNQAGFGGGVACMNNSNPTITACRIVNNWGSETGGLECYSGSSPTITNCTIAGNVTANRSGGVDCSFDSHPTFINCLITGNTANYEGGGIRCTTDCNPTFINCTITGNTAGDSGEGSGGGVYCFSGTSPTISNCILWGNAPDEFNSGATPAVTYSDVEGSWPGVGNINADPLFVDLDGPDGDPQTWEDNDHHLSGGSPCIDAGNNAAVPPGVTTDLDGNPRFLDGDDNGTAIVDIGAYETPHLIPTVSEWGLIVMALLGLTAGTIMFGRRRRPAAA